MSQSDTPLSGACLLFVVLCLPKSTLQQSVWSGVGEYKKKHFSDLKNSMNNSKSGQGHNAQKGLLVQHFYSQS